MFCSEECLFAFLSFHPHPPPMLNAWRFHSLQKFFFMSRLVWPQSKMSTYSVNTPSLPSYKKHKFVDSTTTTLSPPQTQQFKSNSCVHHLIPFSFLTYHLQRRQGILHYHASTCITMHAQQNSFFTTCIMMQPCAADICFKVIFFCLPVSPFHTFSVFVHFFLSLSLSVSHIRRSICG